MEARLELPHPLLLTPLNARTSFRSTNMRIARRAASYSVYSIATLSALFEQQNISKEVPDLRFLVDMNGSLWFARETHDDGPAAPAHKDLANENNCKTAGNLFFNEERTTLLKINHKSGDYRPSFESLNWLLAILFLNEAKLPFALPKDLEIDQLDHAGGLIKTYKINFDEIRAWATTTTFMEKHELVSMLKNQPSITKKITISPPERVLDKESTSFVAQSLFFGCARLYSPKAEAEAEAESDIEDKENRDKGRKQRRLLGPTLSYPSP